MAADVPKHVSIEVPAWLWNGDVPAFFRAARLTVKQTATGLVEVFADERDRTGRPKLVTMREIAARGSWLTDAASELATLDAQTTDPGTEGFSDRDVVRSILADAEARSASPSELGAFTALCAFHQLQTMTVRSAELPAAVRAAWEQLTGVMTGNGADQAFPHAGVFYIRRSNALMHRLKLSTVLLRIEQDQALRDMDIGDLKDAAARGEQVFASSGDLTEGFTLFDAPLGPLLAAMAPFVWAFPAFRMSGVILFTLGYQIRGTESVAPEPLTLLPSRGPIGQDVAPRLSPTSSAAAVTWWVRRIDSVMSVLSDPAVYTDDQQRYSPSRHLKAQLGFDQVLRRVGSLQRSHRDSDVRRVLLFTVLDTLESFGGYGAVDMLRVSTAEKVLKRLRDTMSKDAALLLLPAAERAVSALRQVQDGFFIAKQRGNSTVDYVDESGQAVSLSMDEAAAAYIRVLRNASHGFHAKREARHRADALLAHHDGSLPHDLGLLGWLFLLDLINDPTRLRRQMHAAGRQ